MDISTEINNIRLGQSSKFVELSVSQLIAVVLPLVINVTLSKYYSTGPIGAVANGQVGTGFSSRYRLQSKVGFLKYPIGICTATTAFSFSLTSNRVTTNY